MSRVVCSLRLFLCVSLLRKGRMSTRESRGAASMRRRAATHAKLRTLTFLPSRVFCSVEQPGGRSAELGFVVSHEMQSEFAASSPEYTPELIHSEKGLFLCIGWMSGVIVIRRSVQERESVKTQWRDGLSHSWSYSSPHQVSKMNSLWSMRRM